MKNAYFIAALLCLGSVACAPTSDSLMTQGEQHRYNLTRGGREAANCIAANAERLPNLSASVSVLMDGDAEVTIREQDRQLAFFRIHSDGRNNEAAAYVAYDAARDLRGFSGSLVRGC